MEKDGVKIFYAEDRAAWRAWLTKNHATEMRVWLIIYRKQSGTPSIYYDEAVTEALCFGWIDSKPNKRDGESYYQFFSRRNPKSNWSGVNKRKVEELSAQGLMTEAGWAVIKLAKQNGGWTALDEVENLVIPEDLQAQFDATPGSQANFDAFSKSAKRGILDWISSAKQAETRAKRILETVTLAARNEKANQYVPKK